MVNNPEIINKIISQLKSLTVEKIDEIIKKADKELGYFIETGAKYVENTEYLFNSSILICETIHKKQSIIRKIFNKNEKKYNDLEEAA